MRKRSSSAAAVGQRQNHCAECSNDRKKILQNNFENNENNKNKSENGKSFKEAQTFV